MVTKTEYNKTTTGIFGRCSKCSLELQGGSTIYVPKITEFDDQGKEKKVTFGKSICKFCYEDIRKENQ